MCLVQQLIAQEEKIGISRSRIIIGGFSQGGAVALYSAFALSQNPLGGVLALSTWLPVHYKFPDVSRILVIAYHCRINVLRNSPSVTTMYC